MVEMKAALQKLESRVAVLEKSPAPAAVPCAKVQKERFKIAGGENIVLVSFVVKTRRYSTVCGGKTLKACFSAQHLIRGLWLLWSSPTITEIQISSA